MKGKNKLVPRLLGITKESVMRVDEKTKDVVQEWPLTTVKRWAASPKSFTLVLCATLHTSLFPRAHAQLFHAQCDLHSPASHIQSRPCLPSQTPSASLKRLRPQTPALNVLSVRVRDSLDLTVAAWGGMCSIWMYY